MSVQVIACQSVLGWDDTWTVSRQFVRKGTVVPKRELLQVSLLHQR
jgi:hypothetical protein